MPDRRGRAAHAEFALDGVAVGEGSLETVDGVGHNETVEDGQRRSKTRY